MNQSLIIAVLIAGVFYVGGQYIVSEPARREDHSVTVQATGKAKSVPDIAHITLGVRIEPQPTAKEATDMLAKQGNAVIAAVKKLGIADADIKTENISVQPSYTYDNGKQTLRGLEGSEQLDITVRKIGQNGQPADLAGQIIARGAEAGANQIGGITFKNEDAAEQQLAAEKDAITNAQNKAEELAKALRVRLGKVKTYTVQQNYGGPMPYALEAKAMGGDSVTSPEIPAGTQEHSVTVTVIYEIH